MRTVRLAALAALAALASLLLAGCTPPTVSSSGPSADQACADSAYARCSHTETCSSTAVLQRYGDEGTCETINKQNCLNMLAAPSNPSTPATTEACAQAIPDWACTDFLFSQNPPPECQTRAGQLADGAACAFSGQCQSAFCAMPPGSACGTCAHVPQAGDPCAQLVTCGTGLTCTSDTKQCQPFALQGAACGTGTPCLDGLGCVGAVADAGATGTCQPAVPTQGAPCASQPGCDYFAGLTCNAQSKQCVAMQLVAGGQPCGFVNEQGVNCLAGTCVGSSAGVPGTCQPYAQLGAACDVAAGPQCISPARCFASGGAAGTGTCAIPDGTACH